MPAFPPFSCKPLYGVLRVPFLLALLSASLAHADDHADVGALMRAGKTAEALARAELYLKGKPHDPQMRFLKGVIQADSGKTNDAILTFKKITEDYPDLPEPYNNMAVIYAEQRQFDKAKAALEAAIRTNPSYAVAHENLGDLYSRLASQAYSQALQLDVRNAQLPPKLALIRSPLLLDSRVPQKPAALGAQASGPVTVVPAVPVLVEKPAPIPVPAPPPAAAPAAKAPPVVPAPATSPLPARVVGADAAEKEVEAAVRAWAEAWSGKNMSAYLSSYGQDFVPPGRQSRKSWEEDRRSRIVGKSHISVKLSNLSIDVQGRRASARFKQAYSADTLNISSRKTLDLAKVGKRWVIIRESTGG